MLYILYLVTFNEFFQVYVLVCVSTMEGRRRSPDPQELELESAVGTGVWAQVFWKSTKLSNCGAISLAQYIHLKHI